MVESAESEEAGSAGRAADGDGDGRASQVVEISTQHQPFIVLLFMIQ